jgi:hypothetical protein
MFYFLAFFCHFVQEILKSENETFNSVSARLHLTIVLKQRVNAMNRLVTASKESVTEKKRVVTVWMDYVHAPE